MSFTISTSANFEAAHRLSNYSGKCNALHGHNWKVEITANVKKLDSKGMVFDFTQLKRILECFDHKVLLKNNIENKKICSSLPKEWICWLSFEPTAENIAKDIHEKIISKTKLSKLVIKVWENETSFAQFFE